MTRRHSDEPTPTGWTGIRVSRVVRARLAQLAEERAEDLGRSVSYNEVIEQLLADQWEIRGPS